jgi:uncharacterized protein (TIGR02145 family)
MKRLNSVLRLLPIISTGVLLLGCSKQYKDQDGNLFSSVRIGQQEWMAENLDVVTFRNGDSIPMAETEEEWERAAVEGRPVYCIYYKNPGDNSGAGKLYNWYAFNDSRIIAPKGWHVPSDMEWIELSMELGMSPAEAEKLHERGTDEGTRLKDPGDKSWNLSESTSVKFSGFNAQVGGCRLNNGEYFTANVIAVFWSSTETPTGGAYAYGIHPAPYFNRCDDNKGLGMSVRCIKDK